MPTPDSTSPSAGGRADCPAPVPIRPGLLIVEPEDLLRWSLTTYLSRWFDVYPTETAATAHRIIDEHRIDAIIMSEELAETELAHLAERALVFNHSARIVRTVTHLPSGRMPAAQTCCIEKPFQLSNLAELLGIHVRG